MRYQPVTPDRALVERMAQGDPHAIHELRRRHETSLYALAYSVVFDPDTAEEVVAEAFEQVRRAASSFEPDGGTVFSWLSGLTRSRARCLARGYTASRRPV
jgi:DNA-directed RNA polymerase specialized sigma24 family protein